MSTATVETATQREIAQQPQIWRELASTLTRRSAELQGFLSPLLVADDVRIVLTGAGTSAFAGRALAPALAARLGRRVDAVATTDIVSNPRQVFAQDVPTLLVSFARSGDSPESVAATELADRCLSNVQHLIVTCNPQGRLARDRAEDPASCVLLMPSASNDTGFAMTSSFTSMLLASWLVLTGDDVAVIDRLAETAGQMIDDPSSAQELAARDYQRVVYLGSGGLAGIAQESALKLLELTAGRVVSYHDSSLGFRHGPKAVLDARTLAVVYHSADPYTSQYDDDIIAELQESLGQENVVVIAADRLPGELTGLPDALLSAPYVVFAQQFALQVSLACGLTPDNPFPGGQVNRVVQGVTVHALPE